MFLHDIHCEHLSWTHGYNITSLKHLLKVETMKFDPLSNKNMCLLHSCQLTVKCNFTKENFFQHFLNIFSTSFITLIASPIIGGLYICIRCIRTIQKVDKNMDSISASTGFLDELV